MPDVVPLQFDGTLVQLVQDLPPPEEATRGDLLLHEEDFDEARALQSEVGNRGRHLELQPFSFFVVWIRFRLPCSKRPRKMREVLKVEAGAVHPIHVENNSYLLGQEEGSLPEHSHPSMDPNLRHLDKRMSGKNIHEEVVAAPREELYSDEEFGDEET